VNTVSPATRTRSVRSLERALSILEILVHFPDGLTLAQIARKLRVPKSSLHCILLTFQRCGYLSRDEQTRRYRFELKVLSLADAALSGLILRDRAAPHLYNLMRDTGLTVHMAVLERFDVILVSKVEPPGLLRLATWVGKHMEAHCTGVGKALLAALPPDQVDALLKARGLARRNENTIVSMKKLHDELSRIRQAGYALDDEEDEIGLRCLGAAVFFGSGKAAAAISVAGTSAQIDERSLPELASRVKRTAATISRALGYTAEHLPGLPADGGNYAKVPKIG